MDYQKINNDMTEILCTLEMLYNKRIENDLAARNS